jgi:hypothetical protein
VNNGVAFLATWCGFHLRGITSRLNGPLEPPSTASRDDDEMNESVQDCQSVYAKQAARKEQ